MQMETYNDNLKRLRLLTEHLSSLEEMVQSRTESTIEYNLDQGTALGFGLYNDSLERVNVQRVFMSKGTAFDEHFHPEHEWLIVYSGVMLLKYKDEEREMGIADWTYCQPNVPHSVQILEDTWIIAITVPAGRGYSNAT